MENTGQVTENFNQLLQELNKQAYYFLPNDVEGRAELASYLDNSGSNLKICQRFLMIMI